MVAEVFIFYIFVIKSLVRIDTNSEYNKVIQRIFIKKELEPGFGILLIKSFTDSETWNAFQLTKQLAQLAQQPASKNLGA